MVGTYECAECKLMSMLTVFTPDHCEQCKAGGEQSHRLCLGCYGRLSRSREPCLACVRCATDLSQPEPLLLELYDVRPDPDYVYTVGSGPRQTQLG